jgi:hypothetical protein
MRTCRITGRKLRLKPSVLNLLRKTQAARIVKCSETTVILQAAQLPAGAAGGGAYREFDFDNTCNSKRRDYLRGYACAMPLQNCASYGIGFPSAAIAPTDLRSSRRRLAGKSSSGWKLEIPKVRMGRGVRTDAHAIGAKQFSAADCPYCRGGYIR